MTEINVGDIVENTSPVLGGRRHHQLWEVTEITDPCAMSRTSKQVEPLYRCKLIFSDPQERRWQGPRQSHAECALLRENLTPANAMEVLALMVGAEPPVVWLDTRPDWCREVPNQQHALTLNLVRNPPRYTEGKDIPCWPQCTCAMPDNWWSEKYS